MTFKISVNQVEGYEIQSQNTGCYLSVDGDFIDVITPISLNSKGYLTDLPSSGLLKLILKNMRSGEVIGSLSIFIEKIVIGTQWLPLFDDLHDDLVQSPPSQVDPPRLEVTFVCDDQSPLVTLSTEKIDYRFFKLQEEYEASLKRAEDRDLQNLKKIQELTEAQLELQAQVARMTVTVSEKDHEIAHLNEKIRKMAVENWENEYLALKQSSESYQEDLLTYKSQISRLKEDLQESNEIALSLTSINLNNCPAHESEIQRLNTHVFALKQNILELQRNQAKKMSDKLEAELIKQIKELDEKLEEAEIAKSDLIAEANDLRQELAVQERLIHEMKGFIEGSKTERLSFRDNRARSPSGSRRKDSIDRSLEEYHSGQGIKNNFVKLGRGLYEFGNRKVNVSMKNGTIICRVGGGYVQIDDFLSIYAASLTGSPRKTYSRGNSTSPARIAKNSFPFLESNSGKQTPSVFDSVFDNESLLNYSCDSEDSRTRSVHKMQ
jgi:hypothetical protein